MSKRFLIVVALLVWSSSANAQTVVGLGGSAFFEDTDLNGLQRISVQETDQSENYRSKSFLTAQVWFLLKMSEKFRAGSGIAYYGTYSGATKPDEDQDRDDFEPDFYEFGRLIELFADLLFGAVFGVPILFPGGQFKEEIERLQDQGANVLSLPRIGYMVGPDIGGRYKFNEWLSFRSDIVVTFSQLFLFATTQTIDNTAFRKRWSTRTLRYQFNLGAEINL